MHRSLDLVVAVFPLGFGVHLPCSNSSSSSSALGCRQHLKQTLGQPTIRMGTKATQRNNSRPIKMAIGRQRQVGRPPNNSSRAVRANPLPAPALGRRQSQVQLRHRQVDPQALRLAPFNQAQLCSQRQVARSLNHPNPHFLSRNPASQH